MNTNLYTAALVVRTLAHAGPANQAHHDSLMQQAGQRKAPQVRELAGLVPPEVAETEAAKPDLKPIQSHPAFADGLSDGLENRCHPYRTTYGTAYTVLFQQPAKHFPATQSARHALIAR
ncbi:hypothetical protein [Burkholderia ubonensis]|uniref:hypothetical protein n=1 Tax=Burkholderia ubonensis TaxID=101571 RepID=UPI0012FA8CF5|nr:hypothetical protein [Burkholderia ubonensis]